ncbi:MAG: aspartate kinase [Chitinophagaceae bacterium]|nr:aspartate kinase [Oligoflexus sp.]
MSLYIQKYGGTSVGTLDRIKSVAAHIASTYRQGHSLVVVVSAMGQQTDELLEMALKLSTNPPQREVDMLLSVGERMTMSLLSIALNELKIPTVSFTGSQSGILTDNTFGNARINRILGDRIRRALEDNKLVIVAGFQGMSEQEKEITTLGRGGSDLTAIALTHTLKADRCQIYKDVDGVCSADPRFVSHARVLPAMSWDTLSNLTWYGSGVVHNRGVHLAKKFQIPLEIRSSFNLETHGTMIGSVKPVEKAIVHAITHRKDLAWLRIDMDSSKISEILSYLYTQGEHPLFVQQCSESGKTGVELVVSGGVLPKLEHRLQDLKIPLSVLHTGLICVTAVGDGFWQEPTVIEKALASLQKPTVLFDCKNNVMNMFIQGGHMEEILERLHKAVVE